MRKLSGTSSGMALRVCFGEKKGQMRKLSGTDSGIKVYRGAERFETRTEQNQGKHCN